MHIRSRYSEPQDKMAWLIANKKLWFDKDFHKDDELLRTIYYKMLDAGLYSNTIHVSNVVTKIRSYMGTLKYREGKKARDKAKVYSNEQDW